MMRRVVCAAVLFLAACDANGSPNRASTVTRTGSVPPPGTVSTAALCTDAAAVRSALELLVDITVAPGLVAEVKADVATLRGSVTTLVGDLHGRLQTQVATVQAALAGLGTAVDNLVASPGTGAVPAVQVARAEVSTATQHLLAAVGVDCPGPSPAPSR
jgi:hypothetical protein